MSPFAVYKSRVKVILICSMIHYATAQMALKDLSIYHRCKGKPTGIENFYKDKAGQVTACITASPKACAYQCAFQKAGIIDEETGEFNAQAMRKTYDHYTKLDEEMKDMIIASYERCFGEGRTLIQSGRCENVRKAMYCHYNEYIVYCEMNNMKPKNIDVKSEEIMLDVGDRGLLNRGMPRSMGSSIKKQANVEISALEPLQKFD